MKRVSLKNLNLGAMDMLLRNQLKSIIGGGYGGSGEAVCKTNCSTSKPCTDTAYPTCTSFVCKETDGTETSETVCM